MVKQTIESKYLRESISGIELLRNLQYHKKFDILFFINSNAFNYSSYKFKDFFIMSLEWIKADFKILKYNFILLFLKLNSKESISPPKAKAMGIRNGGTI